MNAWLSEDGLVLGQVFTDEKSNEITAIPELLDILSVAGHGWVERRDYYVCILGFHAFAVTIHTRSLDKQTIFCFNIVM